MIDSRNLHLRKDVLGYGLIGAIVGLGTLTQVKMNDPMDVFIFLACAILASIGAPVGVAERGRPAGLLIVLLGIERLNPSSLLLLALAITILSEAQNMRRALGVMSILFELISVTIGVVAAQATDTLLAPLWSTPLFPARLIAASLILLFNFGLANRLARGVARPYAGLYRRECRPLLPWFVAAAYLAYLAQSASSLTGYHPGFIALPLMLVTSCVYRGFVRVKLAQEAGLSALHEQTIETLARAFDTRYGTAKSRALSLREAMHLVKTGAGKNFDPHILSLLERKLSEMEAAADLAAETESTEDRGAVARSQDLHRLGDHLSAESGPSSMASAPLEPLLLQDLNKDLARSECIEKAISAVHQHLSHIITFDTLAVYVRHDENLEPIRIIGEHEHLFSREGFPIKKGLSGWVAEHHSPILNGVAADECFYTNDHTLQSVVAVPLEGRSGFTGVLALYHSRENAFGRDDLRILQALSTSLGRAIESSLSFKANEKPEIPKTPLVAAPHVVRGLRSAPAPDSRNRGHDHPPMYKVTIQSTHAKQIVWKVAASGYWTPGQQPQLGQHPLAAELLDELFAVTPPEAAQSGRHQIQRGDMLYGVVFRKVPKGERQ